MKFLSAVFKGSGRLADLFGTIDTHSKRMILAKSDVQALNEDWITVGSDMHTALKQYRKLYGRKKKV